ncbi:MAG TPA: methyl-accepting chemotaxis protein [Spirochaetota bacterium]|nr:methyl-accepting chemotaxis protein [Spirochaetota bacterium]HPS87725.1 methyl-accepting chemotaxis protein [Spirochaetota bacterium]
MKSIRTRIILLMTGGSLLSIILLVGAVTASVYKFSSMILEQNKKQIVESFDKNIMNQVQNISSLIDSVKQYQEASGLNDEQGKALAKELIRKIRYGESGYFWLDNYDGVNVLLPPNPKAEGVSRINSKDSTGKEFIKEFIAKGKQTGGGFTDYLFPKPGEKEPSPKRGYTLAYAPYGWIIGTGNYVDDIDKFVQEKREKYNRYINYIVLIMIAAAAVVGLILIIASIRFANSISRPIQDTSRVAEQLSDRDLTSRVDERYLLRKDEIGILAKSINLAAENLGKTISAVQSSMKFLNESIDQINKGNQELAQRTSEQASSIEEIASTMEETRSHISQNTESSVHVSETSKASLLFAEKGGEMVHSAVISINDIRDSSRKISEITSVINSIAFQTNLLALNAAVEAARAGEQGRGFAVVAAEVRNLAQRSASAAKEITSLINDSITKIEIGTKQANNSGDAINEIVESVRNVSNLMLEITASTYEQKTGIDQVNMAINELNMMTQQNAALVEETASASESISEKAKDLAEMTKIFKT